MDESPDQELQCPFCQTGLGVIGSAGIQSVIECPGCGQEFFPENSTEDEVERYLEEHARPNIPAPKPKRSIPLPGGATSSIEGYSKWEHSAPDLKKPDFKREILSSDDYARQNEVKPLEMLTRSKPEDIGHFGHLGTSQLPKEREIDAEQRRRKKVLQRGWQDVDKGVSGGPGISQKENLKFERNLVSTEHRHAEPEELLMKRRDSKAAERMRWEHDEVSAEDANFSMEKVERAQRVRSFFLGFIGFIGLGVVGVAIYFLVASLVEGPPVSPTGTSKGAGIIGTELYDPGDHYDAIVKRLVAYFAAGSPQEMLQYVRDRQRVAPLVSRYYARLPYSPRILRDLPTVESMVVVDGFVVVPVTVGTDRQFLVPLDVQAGLKVDWEATVGYSEMPWEEMKSVRPKESVLLRAYVRADNYYNFEFTNDKYVVLKLTDPTKNHVLFGYLPKASTVLNQFVQLFPTAFKPSPAPILATLDVRYPDFEAGDNQVEITAIGAKGWIFRRDITTREAQLPLFANDAIIKGEDAVLTRDLQIKNWRSAKTTLEWNVTIERPVHVWVSAVLANGGSDSKEIQISNGPQKQFTHAIPSTGDWSTFETVVLGELDFPRPGTYSIRARQDRKTNPNEEPLATLDRLILEGGPDLVGSSVKDPVVKPVIHALTVIHDHGEKFNTRTKEERNGGWKMLFNGRDLTGWQGYRTQSVPDGWTARNGEIVLDQPGAGSLLTVAEYENFEFKLEWNVAEDETSGVFFRVVETKTRPEETGIEIHFTRTPLEQVDPLTSNGSVKHLFPPQPFTPAEDGWNQLHVRFEGDVLQYWINGEEMGAKSNHDIVQSLRVGSEQWKAGVEGSRVGRFQRFAKSRVGHICLEDAGTRVRFRNLKLLEL